MRHFLSLADLPGGELADLLRRAQHMIDAGPNPAALAGKRIVLVFLNPSLRTRTSTELAGTTQGAHVVALAPGADAWKLETRRGVAMVDDAPEHIVDAVRTLGGMADLIGVRTFAGLEDVETDRAEPILTTVVEESPVPVLNMESALDHPLQAVADLLTLQQEFGPDLRGVPVTLTWAPHPKPLPLAVAAAFLRGATRMGMEVRVAAPPEFALPKFLVDEALAAAGDGAKVTQHAHQREAVRGSRAVYAKSWAAPSLLLDPTSEMLARDRAVRWTVTPELMALADDAVFMHCLPVRRGVVVTDGVLDGPRCRVYREAANRLPAAQAVLEHLLASPDGGQS